MQINRKGVGTDSEVSGKLVYLELATPRLDVPTSARRALHWLNRDFPWVLSAGWAVEWWGVRTGRNQGNAPNQLRARGPVSPLRRMPWIVLAPLAWCTHFLVMLFGSRSSIVVARHPYLALGAATARVFRRSPVLVVGIVERMASKALNVHGSAAIFKLLNAVDRFVLRRADLVLLMGPFTRELAERAGVTDDRIIEVPHPVRWIQSNAAPDTERRNDRVVTAARLIPGKGIDVLIESFAIIVKRRRGAELVVAGDGPERARLQDLAARLGIDDHVSFPGWVPPHELPDLYGSALIAALPSRVEEGHPMALQEAALAGCALIGSDLGGIRDIVEPGVTGALVPPEDPHALAEAIERFLADPATARRMGDAARAEALAYYDRREAGLDEFRKRLTAVRESKVGRGRG